VAAGVVYWREKIRVMKSGLVSREKRQRYCSEINWKNYK